MPSSEFSKYGTRVDLPASKSKWAKVSIDGRFYFFQDNGADILAVAHLDSVQSKRFCRQMQRYPKGCGHKGNRKFSYTTIESPSLDDRLGAYTICELLPAMGFKFDILLTTDEECGASTADCFEPEAHGFSSDRYKWMFQFDRAGDDAVCYEYECDELTDALEAAGIFVGMGSYSDISNLTHIGCRGVNFGVAYRDYHSVKSHAYLDEYLACVARFCVFHKHNSDKTYEYDAPYYDYKNGRWSDEYDYDYTFKAEEEISLSELMSAEWDKDERRQKREANKSGGRVFSDNELSRLFFDKAEIPEAADLVWDLVGLADLLRLGEMMDEDVASMDDSDEVQKDYLKFLSMMPNYDLLKFMVTAVRNKQVSAGGVGYMASLFAEAKWKIEQGQAQADSEPYKGPEPHGGLIPPDLSAFDEEGAND